MRDRHRRERRVLDCGSVEDGATDLKPLSKRETL
jgi:hypothetical protein